MDKCWEGLEDCIELLKTGRYEVLTRTEDGEKFIFPKTQPELQANFDRNRIKRKIRSIEDFSALIPPIFHSGYFMWHPTDDFILHLKPDMFGGFREDIAYVGRFSYEPNSREFLPATIEQAHNSTIRIHGSYKFNEYVRGIYVREKKLILIRAYYNPLDKEGKFDPYKGYDFGVDIEKTGRTIEMLVENGLPEDVSIIARANNDLIKDSCLKRIIGLI